MGFHRGATRTGGTNREGGGKKNVRERKDEGRRRECGEEQLKGRVVGRAV